MKSAKINIKMLQKRRVGDMKIIFHKKSLKTPKILVFGLLQKSKSVLFDTSKIAKTKTEKLMFLTNRTLFASKKCCFLYVLIS